MVINSFRDLRVWQAGMDLVESVYLLTRSFPADEKHGLISQMRRAAVSIPSNIAEGHTREHTNHYLYHLSVAQASLAELQTQIEIAGRLHYLAPERVAGILDDAVGLSRQLFALRNSLARGQKSPTPIP